MTSKYWIKLYHEILEDPKMGTLPDHLWRRAIELFLLAGEYDNDGLLPSTEQIAWKLRRDVVTIRDELDQLCVTGIVTKNQDGTWLITNFAKRQGPVPDAERKKQERKRKKAQTEPKKPEDDTNDENERHEGVTNCDIDTDTDVFKKKNNAFAKICKSFEQEMGFLSPVISNSLQDDMERYPWEWIPMAIERASRANKRSLAYIEGILKNWQSLGGPQNDAPPKAGKYSSNGNGSRTSSRQTAEYIPQNTALYDSLQEQYNESA